MNVKHLIPLTALLLAPTLSLAAQAAGAGPPSAAPAFQRFKALAGEWVAAEDGEMTKKGDLVARYAVTAGGTAVVETIFPGTPHEMVTVYTAEGPDVVLTHYCMVGNQPRMRAKHPSGPRFEFAFDGGANVAPASDRHMHSAWVEFVGDNELRSEWTEHAAGKPALVVKLHLVRRTS